MRQFAISRWFRNISIAKKLYFVMGIMALLIATELLALGFSINTLSAIRAYVGAEGLWSKSQKDAIYHLNNYARSGDKKDYDAFLGFVKVPLGDKKARLELEKEKPDFVVARQGFLEALNHPDDVDGLIHVFRRFRNIYYIDKAINIWAEADLHIAKLIVIGEQLDKEMKSPAPSKQKINQLLLQIAPVNEKLTQLENDFSYTLGEGSRWLEGLVLKILFSVALTVEVGGLLLTMSVSNGMSKGINEVLRVAKEVARGNFSAKATIYSKDEIGLLADSFNKMTHDLDQYINELRAADKKIIANEEQFRLLVENVKDYAFFMLDSHGTIISWNQGAENMKGYSAEEIIGKNISVFYTEDEVLNKIPEYNLKIAKENGHYEFETLRVRKDGFPFFADVIYTALYDAKGALRGYSKIIRDITERKKTELKLSEYTHILELKNTQLVDFCSIVSHNLRAPLVNIAMLINFIEECEDEQEREELIVKIQHVITHLNEVFSELVESVQVRQDTEIKLDKINLKNSLTKVLIGFESQIKSFEADIQIDFKESPEIYYPHKYIDSIFANLISNALKYKSPDRKPIIKIKTEIKRGNTILSIADNGLGIDLKLHKNNVFKIRKVFHKHPDAKGFGLFLTKTQVEAMDGKIWVESTPNVGTTFFVEFKGQMG